jgi:DNA-binding MarR family transcriptional regulator
MPEDSTVSPATAALQQLSDLVHQRSRLSILATLHEVGRAEFTFLVEVTGLTDGNLSRHLQVLVESDLVSIEKTFVARRPRTTIELTPSGRRAFDAEVAILRGLVETTEQTTTGRMAPTRRRRRSTPTTTAPLGLDAG